MKINKIISLLLTSFCLLGCHQGEDITSNTPSPSVDDIYNVNDDKRDVIVGKARYKASDGYMSNTEQGYNNFYYKVKYNNSYLDMIYSNGQFAHQSSYLKNEEMKSENNYYATRAFMVPVSGNVKINGNFKSKDPNLIQTLVIYLNDRKIDQYIASDIHGNYVNLKINVTQGDYIYFVLETNGEALFNPSIDYIQDPEDMLHQTIDGEYGDVHPFYDEKNNLMYMYYLSTGREQHSVHEQFSTLATVSDDMVNFKQVELSKNKNNPPSITTYYALGIYEDSEGIYRSCFGMGSYVGCSKSSDLLYWENGEEVYMNDDGMIDFHHRVNFGDDVYSGRDPHIYYDKERQTYYCVVMNYYSSSIDRGSKGLAIYSGDINGDYSKNYLKALDCTGRGDPECPEIFKIGDRYYLFYSIFGTGTAGNVGKLADRIGDKGKAPTEVNWDSKHEYYLDGGDLHAAQLCMAGDRLYMYGWLTSTPHVNSWGGTLNLSREVYQKDDGTLGSRLHTQYKNNVNDGLIAPMESDSLSGLPRSIINSTITLNSGNYGGFNITSNGRTYFAGIIKQNNKTYLSITNDINKPTSFIFLELNESAPKYDLSIYLDNGYVEVFVNDEYGISSHVEFNGTYSLNKTSDVAQEMSNCKIYKLADAKDVND